MIVLASDPPQSFVARVLTGLRKLWGDSFEYEGAFDLCDDCGQPCASVTHLPKAKLCSGPLTIAQCAECVGVVETDKHPRYHVTANERRVKASEFYKGETRAD